MASITIKDIAKETGVSIATVSRVLNNTGYASEEIREKVLSTAMRLNYLPNAVARSLKNEKTNTIGVVIPDITNSYFMQISKGIEDTIHQYGYNLIFGSGNEHSKKESEMLQVLFEKRVDAIVLATSGGNEEIIEKIKKSGIPIVLIDRKINGKEHDLDLVIEDNIEAAYELTKHLLDLGHTRIGVVNGSLTVSTGIERYRGYQKAIQEKGITEDPKLIFNGGFIESDGKEAVDRFLQLASKPTAILSFNNTMTFGVLLQLISKGYEIPEDIVVASYGEVEAAKLLKSQGITYTNQIPYEMGVRTGEILIDRLINSIQGPIHEVFKPTINFNEQTKFSN
ncbi:LacI family DNA-binding transcriptional regulator [Alkalihalobacillus sp. AL-G]|uniref:LacI family DNA-binding transcriptional regulator n=1 Tax=Alkalihalobacillus sp. AL-G TaxID=2926399 RepID=UPI002729A44C|nr:LacI family DNA-binding transcriptional regulator [Alkalihalobacillus sp. AL-G]WLD93838.1 LacI family transcriptional regulator [Alkalihalobacillus sp. AL-G]